MTGTDVLDADGRRGFRGRLVAVVLGVVLAGGACSSADDAPDSATQGSRPAADSATTAGDHGESSPPTDAAVTDLATRGTLQATMTSGPNVAATLANRRPYAASWLMRRTGE